MKSISHYNLSDVYRFKVEKYIPETLNRHRRRHFRDFAKKFVIIDSKLMYRGSKGLLEAVYDDKQKEDVFRNCHSAAHMAHSGINKTVAKIKAAHYWLGVREFVRQRIMHCDACQKQRHMKTETPDLKPIKATVPWQIIGMDLFGPFPPTKKGHCYALTLTCLFSNWIISFPLRDKSAVEVSKKVLKVIYLYGKPKSILIDQGQKFVSDLNKFLLRAFEIRHLITPEYCLQTNSQDKRTNNSFKEALAEMVNAKQDNWDTFLGPITLAINTSKQKTINKTSYDVMFGRRPLLFSVNNDAPTSVLVSPNDSTDEACTMPFPDDTINDATIDVSEEVIVYMNEVSTDDAMEVFTHEASMEFTEACSKEIANDTLVELCKDVDKELTNTIQELPTYNNEDVERRIQFFCEIHAEVWEKIHIAQQRQKKEHKQLVEKRCIPLDCTIGDKVLKRNVQKSTQPDLRNIGHMFIESKMKSISHFNLRDVYRFKVEKHIPEALSRHRRRHFRDFAKKFVIIDSKLMYRGSKGLLEAVYDDKQKEDVFRNCHSSAHSGINRTVAKIRAAYYWLGVREFVKQCIMRCDACQKQRHMKTVTLET